MGEYEGGGEREKVGIQTDFFKRTKKFGANLDDVGRDYKDFCLLV